MASRRLKSGGTWIDRSKPIGFRFDGRSYEGFEGDTLASALLANGVDVICSSPILGRPRGVFSAGVEEPCAFVEVTAPRSEPIAAATAVELVDGLTAAGRPGVGRLSDEGGPSIETEHRHAHVETLVVGGGIAGLRAAVRASRSGDRVLLVDERSRLGGTAGASELVDGEPAFGWIAATSAELDGDREAIVLTGTTALGVYDMGSVVLYQRAGLVDRVWHARAGRVVLATGSHERPIAFADDDRPGVMLASAARFYIDRFGVLPGERAVVFATNQTGHAAAMALAEAGAEVAAVIDVGEAGAATEEARARGIDVRTGWVVTGLEGAPRVSAIHVATRDGTTGTIDADLLLVAGGWNPAVQLWRSMGGGLRYDDARSCFVPNGDGPEWLSVEGRAAGEGLPTCEPYWYTPAEDLSRHFVDFQRDSTVADVLDAVGHELRSVEHIKRATYIGTAIDQGRTSSVLTAAIVNGALGADPGAQGPTNARPPYTPVSFGALAGRDRGPLLDPIRVTPIHPWHVERGAVFENVGQWKRPRYFPQGAESMQDSVHRECLAVRTTVGVMDASTLGKIEVVGPDAPRFLDRMYTNAMSSLRIGSIRYGLMCGLDGMVLDDGVVMRLGEDRYFATTTTGGAATVLDHFEEWLQTEWPDLRVYCTSVTEQWATIAINGPGARDVVAALGTDVDLGHDAFPFMTVRDGIVAGVPARLARVSFSGELAFEINVAGVHGLAMWEAVIAAGAAFGIVPYGTEAMHVLRAEKGFAIVGQDTDGTVTPHDLGMSWIVNEMKGDFIGRRSLRRPDTARVDRKHLVGLLPGDSEMLVPEGAQLVLEDTGRVPMAMVGHVTSSYRSPILDRTFALAMLERGRELHGTVVFAPMPGGTIAAEVTAPVFYDPAGERRDG
jgi:sarcosine oxidase subunit alpha